MKLPSLKTSIGGIILFFLVLLALIFVRPVYSRLLDTVKNAAESYRIELEKKSGLTFTYESVSPSILPALNIKGIEVSNLETKEKILFIKKLAFTYNIFDLIQGNYLSAFKKLTIDGLSVDWNDIAQKKVRSRLSSLLGYVTASENSQDTTAAEANPLNSFVFKIPFDIDIKNSFVKFEDNRIALTASIKEIDIAKLKSSDNYATDIEGTVSADLKDKGFSFSGIYSASGTVFKNLFGSSIQFHLSDIQSKEYTLEQADFVLTYNKSGVHFETLRSLLPLYISAAADLETGAVSFNAAADALDPFHYVTIKKSSEIQGVLRGSKLSFTAAGNYNLKDNSLNYSAKGKIHAAEKLLGSKAVLAFDVNGDTQKIRITKFSVTGDKYDVSIDGTYWYKNFRFSGTASAVRIEFPGGTVSGEFYFDPLDRGFMCFSPQLSFGNHALTALQLSIMPQKDSVDFSFEVNDYSHTEADEPAKIKLSGSYLIKENYIQAGIDVENLFLDSVADISAVVTNGKIHDTVKKISSSLKPYLLSGELYLSSDFKTVTFNVPYSIIADTRKEGRMIVCSFDGNNEAVNVSRFDMVFGNMDLNLNASISIDSKTKDRFFTTSFILNSIPYNFNGTMSDNWINILGDYGFYASIDLADKGILGDPNSLAKGSLSFSNLPVSIDSYILTLSINTAFKYTKNDGFSMDFDQFYVEEVSGKISFHPKIAIAGSINKYGAFLNKISYSDSSSLLDGKCSLLWNFSGNIPESLNIDFGLSGLDSNSSEKISLKGNITNPQMKQFSSEMFKNDLYFSMEGNVDHFLLSRLMQKQNSDDTVSFDLSLNGTVSAPSVSLNIKDSSVNLSGYPALFSGDLSFMDGTISVRNTKFKWNGLNIDGIRGNYSLDTKEGSAGAQIDVMDGKITIPLEIGLQDSSGDAFIPDTFSLAVKSSSVSESLIKSPFAFKLNVIKTPGRADIFSSQNLGLSGYYLKNGTLSLSSDGNIKFQLGGTILHDKTDLKLEGVSADLAALNELLNIDSFKIYAGIFRGSMRISGDLSNPDMTGAFSIKSPEFTVPGLYPDHFYSDTILATISDNQIRIPEFKAKEDNGYALCSAKVVFDNFTILSAGFELNTFGDDRIPVKIDMPFMKASGPLKLKISMLYESGTIHLTSVLDMQKTNVVIISSHLQEAIDFLFGMGDVPIDVDITFLFKEHVQFRLDPMLRCVVTPGSTLKIDYQSSVGDYIFDGKIGFKGGDVAYLNRNFYLKDGGLIFNPNTSEPRISLVAETRERDEDDKNVTITLSAENQLLSEFSPTISTTPAKSETELQELLGQIASADSDNVGSLLLATGDYVAQVTVIRKIENTLRDLLNFDIFSIRTQIIQNALKQQLNLEKTTNKYTFGNFLDNSTVYVGKYLGSSLYVDALMAWIYDETKDEDSINANGLVFQPSFGLEMDAPFANIRWDISPDIDAIKNNRWVPSTSITLSWKFTF